MLIRPKSCEGCRLHDDKIAIGYSQPEGLGSSGVLVIAEALGQREASDGLPLRPNAPAGSVFQGIIRRISGLDRSQLLLSNTLWCQPGNRNWLDGAPYEHAAIEHCVSAHSGPLIRSRRPRAIVALGAIPTRTITGMSGHNQGIKLIRGFIIDSSRPEFMLDGEPIPVIPTYHPSFLLRASKTRSKDKEAGGGKVEKAEGGMALAGVVRRDIELALSIAKHGRPAKRKFEVIKGDREVMDALIRETKLHPERALAWDIETPRSVDMADDESEIDSIQAQVTQIQFALDAERGFVFPGFDAVYVKEGVRTLLSLPNRKYSWNGWGFDNKVVTGHHGIPILGEDIDLMSAWSWVQPDLPKGLQFATSFYAPELGPWKHYARFGGGEGDDTPWDDPNDKVAMDYYGACDVISLHLNAEGIFGVMASRGLRTSYDRHVLRLRPEMVAAQRRGFPVDPEKHAAFGVKVFAEIEKITSEIQPLIPEAILNLEPKKKAKGSSVSEYGYVNTPKQLLPFLTLDLTTEDGTHLQGGLPLDGSDRVSITEQVPLDDEEGKPTSELGETKVVYVRRELSVFDKTTISMVSHFRWCRLVPFKVGSVPQKLAYIQFKRDEEIGRRLAKGQDRATAERLTKYKIPKVKNKDKELKDNTGAKELDKLFKTTEDPVFRMLVDVGKLKKIHGTYVKGWPVKDGYVHTTFGLASTGTGQLTSTSPNIQNAVKHSALGKEFRGCIVAKPGKVLLEFDKKSFHAQTMALEAKDKDYARLAAIDVHSYNAAIRLKLPEAPKLLGWSDVDLKAWFKMKKKESFIYKHEACVAYPDGMTFGQIRDFKTKKVGLGINFCQGANSIYEQNSEGYANAKEVQTILDAFYVTFPKIKKFQNEIAQLAHKQTYLISRWGYIRRFHDVFQWNSNKWNAFANSMGDWAHGDDFEAAVAFLVANDAFGQIKEEALRLGGYRIPQNHPEYGQYVLGKKMWPIKAAEDLLERYGFCNQVHDSLFFHCDEPLKDRCIEDVLTIMREPCPTLADPDICPQGLFVDASCNIGPDWSSMVEIEGV